MKKEIIFGIALIAMTTAIARLPLRDLLKPVPTDAGQKIYPEPEANHKLTASAKSTLRFKTGSRTLLVMMGSCDSCGASKYAPGREQGKFDQVVLAYSVMPKILPKVAAKYSFVKDEGQLAKELNCGLFPRGYVFDGQGVLEYVQRLDQRFEDMK